MRDWAEIWGPRLIPQTLFIEKVSDDSLAIGPDDVLVYSPSQLAPGFTDADDVPSFRVRIANEHQDGILTPRENQRMLMALEDAHRAHWSHTDAMHPMCRTCVARRLLSEGAMGNADFRDLEYSSGADANANARNWVIRYGNKPFPPADTSHIQEHNAVNQYLTRDQLDDLPRPDPLIAGGILSRHSYALLVGRDSTYKTFLALDWALCIATGKPWQGHEVVKLPVLFIAGEGAYGIAQRVDAWEYAWGEKVQPEQFITRQSAVNLFRGGEPLRDLLNFIEDNRIGLVVIDTLAKASAGANMQGSESSLVLENLERIKRATADGTVLTIAHTQKSDMDTSGLHQIEDDADTVWHAAVDDAVLTVTNRKQKDSPTSPQLRLETQQVLESLVLQSTNGPRIKPATDAQEAILETLEEAFSELGASKQELLVASGVPRSTFYRAFNALLKSGQVTGDDSKTPRFRAQSHASPTSNPTQSHSEEGAIRE